MSYSPSSEVDLSAITASLNTIDGIVDAILVDTGTTLPSTLATIDGIADSILTDTGSTLPATCQRLIQWLIQFLLTQ